MVFGSKESTSSTVTLRPRADMRGISVCAGDTMIFVDGSLRETISSKKISILRSFTFTALGVGLLRIKIGGVLSIGPPLGLPMLAHEYITAAAIIINM